MIDAEYKFYDRPGINDLIEITGNKNIDQFGYGSVEIFDKNYKCLGLIVNVEVGIKNNEESNY